MLQERRVLDRQTGKYITIRTIPMNPESFGETFSTVFGKNVARARRENKKLLGVTDVAPAD